MLPEGDPQPILRRWLPHFLMLAAIVASLWLLGHVVAPLFEPILLAASLAMLTSPVVFEPIDDILRKRLPKLEEELRRRIAGVAATVTLGIAILAPVAVLVISAVGSIQEVLRIGIGVIMRKPAELSELVTRIDFEVMKLNEVYPKLHLAEWGVAESIGKFLGEATDMSSAFLSFIASGTGAMAQLALAIITLAFCFVEGPRVSRAILHYSPLRDDQQETLLRMHRATVLRLLNDTVAHAIVKGLLLGGVTFAVNQLLTVGTPLPLPFVLVAIVAGVITLLPLVGVTVVWLPLAGLYWTKGEHVAAVELAILCWGLNFLLERALARISKRIDTGSNWRSFLLFLGLVGGLLSFGVKGLIIGPMSVVLVTTVCSAWLPLYGGDAEAPDAQSGAGADGGAAGTS